MNEESEYVTVPCVDCGEPVITEQPAHSDCPEFAGYSPRAEYGVSGVPVDELEPVIAQLKRRAKVLEGGNTEAAKLVSDCITSLENTLEGYEDSQ